MGKWSENIGRSRRYRAVSHHDRVRHDAATTLPLKLYEHEKIVATGATETRLTSSLGEVF